MCLLDFCFNVLILSQQGAVLRQFITTFCVIGGVLVIISPLKINSKYCEINFRSMPFFLKSIRQNKTASATTNFMPTVDTV